MNEHQMLVIIREEISFLESLLNDEPGLVIYNQIQTRLQRLREIADYLKTF
jgi:hypothetical protein